ncbi:unnamed protein product [Nezara viridula]|uniref:Uncharacterized protein n=1 Tax=Nezara viridula TaxID=85310 RepID=A0A9P0HJC3_NEZVI|nr:unnamed protein product [Nezara viridula]
MDEKEYLIPKTSKAWFHGFTTSKFYGSAGMDSKRKKENFKNPREEATFISILTFLWIIPVLKKCKYSIKKLEDFYGPLKEDSSALLGDQLEKLWKNELLSSNKHNRKPSLLRALILSCLKSFISYGLLLSLIEFILRLGTPLFLIPFINYFESNSNVSEQMFKLSATGLILAPFLMVFLINFCYLEVFHIGMKLRVAVSSLIYRKVLSLSKAELNEISTGYIVNLLANDAARFDYVVTFIHDVWIGPFQTIIISIFLWYYTGEASIVGVTVIICSIPLVAWLGKITSRMRLRTALKTDDRICLMNEIIVGIQIIKLYVWEKPFEKLVSLIRRKEIKVIRKLSYLKGILYSLAMFQTRIAVFLTILTHILLGNDITASKVFVITSFFNVLHLTVTEYFNFSFSQVSECYTSVKRIEKFLLQGNNLEMVDSLQENRQSESIKGIRLINVSINWNQDMPNILNNVTFDAKPGELTIIIGPVGSGKTSLFHAILKEISLTSGSIDVNGRISYASQEPWLFAASVKQNILFGQIYSEDRFKRVIKVCALEKDIESFANREETLVGERGVTLSGGQKARINLARAVYRNADIYLLDDPLSAVDVNVQKHLFNECIMGILKDKVVLLATHQLQFLNSAKQIVILEKGHVKKIGTYDELIASGLDFSAFVENKSKCEVSTTMEGDPTLNAPTENAEKENVLKEPETPIVEDLSNKNLKFSVFWNYFTIGNKWYVLLFLLLLSLMSQTAATGGDYWISYWLVLEEKSLLRNESSLSGSIIDIFNYYPSRNLCIYILALFILINVIITLFRSALFFNVCMQSSVNLHDKSFKAVSRSPMHFFNVNPSGRILNRFSKDIGNIDEILPSCMIDCLQILLSTIGIFVIVPVTNPWFLIPTCIVMVLFYLLRQFFVAATSTIKRFEGIARSPIYTHLSASLQGLTTIRALKAESIVQQEFDNHQDTHSAAWYIFISAVRAVSLWLEIICAFYNGLITLTFTFFDPVITSGNVGLAITQTNKLTSSLQWGIRQSAEVENQMTSVERVLDYTKLKEEAPLLCPPDKKPSDSWPSKGKLVFREVYLRYNDTAPWILNGISFSIEPTQKVGIVGRTGAGKSSLISALFRLFEVKGLIEIDGLDISSIGLWTLRSKISVIPQNAVLFMGTFRYNLDPFDQYTDQDIWKALEEVELKEYIKSFPAGLQTKVQEGGSNLSVGQRQLISLARAILRGNKILVLDEATANVDLKTDALIQKTIRRKFMDCTVMTIAHRLNSIMDSDLVMVMDNGYLVEFDHPYLLLKNQLGIFRSLCEQSGCIAELSSVAIQKYNEIQEK